MEAHCLFIAIWVESNPNCSFLLRLLKHFLMEGEVLWQLGIRRVNAPMAHGDFPECWAWMLRRKLAGWDRFHPGGFWFLKKGLVWEEEWMEKRGRVCFHLELLILLGRPLCLAEGEKGIGQGPPLATIFCSIYLFSLSWSTQTGRAASLLMGKTQLNMGKHHLLAEKGGLGENRQRLGDELDLYSVVSSPDSLPVKVSLDMRLFSYQPSIYSTKPIMSSQIPQ